MKILKRIFIDGLSGMAIGLFATLIIGTILEQIGTFVGGDIGHMIVMAASIAKVLTGAGIGIGVACKLGEETLVCASAASAGMIGAFATGLLDGSVITNGKITLSGPGEPLGAFVAAYIGIELGRIFVGRTKLDIILTPFITILGGGAVGLTVGASLLDINRTSIYYKGSPVSDDELACKEIIDHLHTDNPTWGARQMSAQLKTRGYRVGRRKARRYMNEMDIHPIYPKMNLSKRMQQAKVCPYLLRNAVIDKPNQVWSIDITYIPIKHGFLYLTAVIDWYSRCIVGWEVDDTLDTRMVLNALNKAFKIAKPQILNSDQGCQFTSQQYIDFVKENGIRQSMDGKSRWADNIMIERWFRSFKYEEAYLTQYNNIKEARAAIKRYVHTYNFERYHSALDYHTPAEYYYPAMLMSYVA